MPLRGRRSAHIQLSVMLDRCILRLSLRLRHGEAVSSTTVRSLPTAAAGVFPCCLFVMASASYVVAFLKHIPKTKAPSVWGCLGVVAIVCLRVPLLFFCFFPFVFEPARCQLLPGLAQQAWRRTQLERASNQGGFSDWKLGLIERLRERERQQSWGARRSGVAGR